MPALRGADGAFLSGIDMTFFREMGVAERLLKRMGKEEGFRDLESSLVRCIGSWP